MSYFPKLVRDKAAVQRTIVKLFEDTSPLIPMKNYVLDVALSDSKGAKIIEINPFVRPNLTILACFNLQFRSIDVNSSRVKLSPSSQHQPNA